MRKVLILLLLVAIVATTSLPAGPVEDQAIEPQAKPESRRRRVTGNTSTFSRKYHAEKNCESCQDETDRDCKIRKLECIVNNITRALTMGYKFKDRNF